MIGVPLSGGKTLNVTFRSLNTRGDVFHSYTQTAAGSSPNGKKQSKANDGLQGLNTAACITSSPANSPERSRKGNSSLPPPKMQSNTKNSIRGAAAEYQQQPDDHGLGIGEQRKEELKKVVQLGVMRGLSSHRQTRKNSRTSRLMAPATEKTYMQLRMRNDGVVPFQNTSTQHGHQMMQPFYLTGVSGFYNATGASNRPQQNNARSQNRTGRVRDIRGMMATNVDPRAAGRKNVLNVSQMGSQTSTDKFGEGGTKNTQTNQSMNETFELTNMIGGASIEMQENERNKSVDINSQAFAQNTQASIVLAQQQQHQQYSKLEEANSSIDQPSFQTEHEATFLWNNAKIIQNSLGGNSRGHLAERSPSRNQLSQERNSFAFDSFMGQQKSHNLSLDSPRRVAGGVVVHERGELIHSHGGHTAGLTIDHNSGVPQLMVGQTRGQNTSLSPRMPGGVPQKAQNQQQRGNQQMNRKNKDLQGGSVHTDQMKVSSTLSPRKQISARESIQERFKAATIHQLIPIGVENQLGPIQGHSMQLSHNQQETKKVQGVSQEPASSRHDPQQQVNESVKDYEAMILAQPSKHTETDQDQLIDVSQSQTAKRVSKISVDDVRGASYVERGLSKTETQVGVGGEIYESATQSQAEGQESPLRITNQKNDSVAGGMSPESVQIPAITTDMTQKIIPDEEQQPTTPEVRKDGGVAIGRFNTILLNDKFSSKSPAPPLNDSINIEDPGTVIKADETTQFENDLLVDNVQQVIACEITASHDDKNGKIHCTTIHSSLDHLESQGVGNFDNIKQHVIPSAQPAVETGDRDNRRGSIKQQVVSSRTGTTSANQGKGEQVTRKSQASGQDGVVSGPTAQLKMEISSIAAHTKHSSNNSGSQNTVGGDEELQQADLPSIMGEELLTNAALHNKIGNLALTFPNSLQAHSTHYKRVNQDQQTGEAYMFMSNSIGKSKPLTGDRTRRVRVGEHQTMQTRPDLCNLNPDDLDEDTLRNMHAIGINFVTKQTNRLKPYESKATKNRKWRNNQFDAHQTYPHQEKTEKELFDYDGSSSNAENVKILQRRLAAWPTYDKASGIGNDPEKLVGATISNPLDQISYMSTTEHWNATNQPKAEQLLEGLPEVIRNLETPCHVKSAVGSSRNQKKIQVQTLIEKSQADTLTGTHQILDSPTKTRHLQTQGCQRTTLQMRQFQHNQQPSQPDAKNQQKHFQTFQAMSSNSPTTRGGKKVSEIKQQLIARSRQSTVTDSEKGATLIKGRDYFREPDESFKDTDKKDRLKFASFSLQVRRRTDQQSNYLSKVHDRWYDHPIEVVDQRVSQSLQRSADVSDALKQTKARQKARLYQKQQMRDMSPLALQHADSINGSRMSMQLDDGQIDKSAGATTNQHYLTHAGQKLNFTTQRFDFQPKTAAVSHRMKAFCCNVPDKVLGRPPYQNGQSQKPGLSPKAPVVRHGIFGPCHNTSQISKSVSNSVARKTQSKDKKIKQFARPMVVDAQKCQVVLHQNINNALVKNKKADQITLEEESMIKNKVNRADLRNLYAYNTFKDRVQSLHVPKLLTQVSVGQSVATSSPPSPLQQTLNDPERVNAYAVLNFRRDHMPGSLNGRKLHTSQLSVTPELRLDIMLQQQNSQQPAHNY